MITITKSIYKCSWFTKYCS